MANASLSRVNQKLAYARALLKIASVSGHPTSAAERLQLQALMDAVVFHLVCGFHHYLRELAENYRVADVAEINDCSSLVAALAAIDKAPAEATELTLLVDESNSWLGQLQRYYKSVWSVSKDDSEHRDNDAESDNLIAVKILEGSDQDLDVDLEILRQWENAFSSLIARQRETSSEY